MASLPLLAKGIKCTKFKDVAKISTSYVHRVDDGSIREGGGKIGEIGAAKEEVYFRKKSAEQLESLKKQKLQEIKYHEEQQFLHQEAIEAAKEELHEIAKESKDGKGQ